MIALIEPIQVAEYTVVLRPMELGDADELLTIRNSPDVFGVCLKNSRRLRPENHRAWVEQIVSDDEYCGWVLDGQKRGHHCCVLGSVAYCRMERGASIGLSVDKTVRRCHLATKMVTETVDRAMEILGVRAVSATVLVSNTASRLLFRRLGWENLGVGPLYGAEVEIHQYPPGVEP